MTAWERQQLSEMINRLARFKEFNHVHNAIVDVHTIRTTIGTGEIVFHIYFNHNLKIYFLDGISFEKYSFLKKRHVIQEIKKTISVETIVDY